MTTRQVVRSNLQRDDGGAYARRQLELQMSQSSQSIIAAADQQYHWDDQYEPVVQKDTVLNDISRRLSTFKPFTSANYNFSVVDLARRGYFYLSEEQLIQCYLCKTTINQNRHDIATHHIREKPDCPIARDHVESLEKARIRRRNFMSPPNPLLQDPANQPDPVSRTTTPPDESSGKRTLERDAGTSKDQTDTEAGTPMDMEADEPFEFEERAVVDSEKIANTLHLKDHEMRFEQARLDTFEFSNVQQVSSFAECGFYYKEKVIKCYACSFSAVVQSWQSIVELHASISSDCPFLKDLAHNVPVAPKDRKVKTAPEKPKKSLGLDSKYLERLLSFDNWIKEDETSLTPEEARINTSKKSVSTVNCAMAGFSYDGTRDQISCSECGLVMVNIQPGIDMLIEHSSHSPSCEFIKRAKGVNYYKDAIDIKNVALGKAKKNPLPAKVVDFNAKAKTLDEFKKFADWAMYYVTGTHVEYAKNLGFPPKLVHQVVSEKYHRDKNTYRKVEDLIAACQKKMEPMFDLEVPHPFPDRASVAPLGLCGSCLEEKVSHMMIGCGHLTLCGDCAELSKHCLTCHKPNAGIMRVYTA